MELAQAVFEQLDAWATRLVGPALPLRKTPVGTDAFRLDFRQQIPHSVMLGKLVRAVSGLRGARVLAESGYVTECAVVLRVVSDFCAEISVIGHCLHEGGELPVPVRDFVADYFSELPRTPEEFATRQRRRYVSREALLKTRKAITERLLGDATLLDTAGRFLNMSYDAYVHGASETTMELWNSHTGRFEMRGHPDSSKRDEFIEAVFLKMHGVVAATELTAAVTAHKEVFEQARAARRAMDEALPWRYQPTGDPA